MSTPPPSGFRQIAPQHTVQELCKMYKRGGETIRRWLRETGAVASNTRGVYNKRNVTLEVNACLSCPYPKCKLDIGKRCELVRDIA